MIIEKLQSFNFSKMEAMVYVTLAKYPNINGSQIAKLLNASRSSVYAALDNLCTRGAAFLVPGDANTTEYRAQRPEILMANLEKEYFENIEYLKNEFANFEEPEEDYQYINIKGEQNFIIKVKELINKAEKEISLNTNYDLHVFQEELNSACARGVRIILFSFEKHNLEGLSIEEYYYNSKFQERNPEAYKRMMLVIDLKTVLIVGGRKSSNYFGAFTNNPLLVLTVAEHINHDIYLLKLAEKYGEHMMDGINMNTLREQEFWKEISFYKVKI